MPRSFPSCKDFSTISLPLPEFPFQDDVGPAAVELFRDLAGGIRRLRGQERDERRVVGDQRGVGHDRRNRDILREHFVARVVDRAALRRMRFRPIFSAAASWL